MDTMNTAQMSTVKITGDSKTYQNDRKLAASPSIHQLYMALALHHENVIARVFSSSGPDTAIARADAEVRQLLELLPGKCPDGYMWSEKLGRCVPILY